MHQGTVHRTLTSPRLLGYRMRQVPEKERGDLLQYVVRYEHEVVGICACAACTDDPATPRMAAGEVLHKVGEPVVAMKPVCDMETWLVLQRELKLRDTRGLRRTKAKYGSKVRILSGLLYCGLCGHRLTAQPRKLAGGRTGVRYRCQTPVNRGKSVCKGQAISGDRTEVWVEEFVLTYLDDAKLAEARRIVDEESVRRTGESSVQTRLAAARRRKEQTEHAYDSGESYTGEQGFKDYRREMDKINKVIDDLTAELAKIAGPVGPHFDVETNLQLRDLWATLDDSRKRAVYDQVIAKIVVMPGPSGVYRFDGSRLHVELRF